MRTPSNFWISVIFRDIHNICHGGWEGAAMGTGENDRMRAMSRREHDGENAGRVDHT